MYFIWAKRECPFLGGVRSCASVNTGKCPILIIFDRNENIVELSTVFLPNFIVWDLYLIKKIRKMTILAILVEKPISSNSGHNIIILIKIMHFHALWYIPEWILYFNEHPRGFSVKILELTPGLFISGRTPFQKVNRKITLTLHSAWITIW